MGTNLLRWLLPREKSPDELDREAEEYRQQWRGRRARALQNPLAVASSELMGPEMGPEVEASGISLVPNRFEGTLFCPLDQRCPLCGESTVSGARRSIMVHFTFRGQRNWAAGAWAHHPCVEGCIETEEDAGVPW